MCNVCGLNCHYYYVDVHAMQGLVMNPFSSTSQEVAMHCVYTWVLKHPSVHTNTTKIKLVEELTRNVENKTSVFKGGRETLWGGRALERGVNWEILKWEQERCSRDAGSENVGQDKYAKWGKVERAQ